MIEHKHAACSAHLVSCVHVGDVRVCPRQHRFHSQGVRTWAKLTGLIAGWLLGKGRWTRAPVGSGHHWGLHCGPGPTEPIAVNLAMHCRAFTACTCDINTNGWYNKLDHFAFAAMHAKTQGKGARCLIATTSCSLLGQWRAYRRRRVQLRC